MPKSIYPVGTPVNFHAERDAPHRQVGDGDDVQQAPGSREWPGLLGGFNTETSQYALCVFPPGESVEWHGGAEEGTSPGQFSVVAVPPAAS